jgi:folate-binding protein YgfZ
VKAEKNNAEAQRSAENPAQEQETPAAELATPRRALHQQAGATFASYFGVSLPESFGDTAQEYRCARESAVLLDTSFRAVFFLTGPDRVRYLNAVTSNDIASRVPGQGVIGLLLNPQGHILAELETYALPDRLLILSHAVVRQRTFATLDKFIIMDDAALEDATERFASLHLEGPQAGVVLRQQFGVALDSLPEFAHTGARLGELDCRILSRSMFGQAGAEILVPREAVADAWQKLAEAARARGGGPIGYAALNALRLEAGVPWFGYDFDDKVIPHEAALESTHISFTKGCYTGQEIVERVRSRGQVNRRRVGLSFSGSAPPAPGTKLLAGGKEVGHVTSAAFSPALGRPIGMGYLRRENTAPGSTLEYSDGTATVISLPLAQ